MSLKSIHISLDSLHWVTDPDQMPISPDKLLSKAGASASPESVSNLLFRNILPLGPSCLIPAKWYQIFITYVICVPISRTNV